VSEASPLDRGPGPGEALTDVGNARRLAAVYGGRLRHVVP